MVSTLERQSVALAEAAKARQAFLETHGRSIQKGPIHYNEKSFAGTEQDIHDLQLLVQTQAFQKQFPNHYVYAHGAEVFASMPREFPAGRSEQYRQDLTTVYEAVTARGITLFKCAIITTGPGDIPSTSLH